jgi:hypothetical protein
MKVCKYHSKWHEDDDIELTEDGGECVDCQRNQEKKASKPPRITVNKQVYWSAGGRAMAGKVKQIFSDHAVVTAEGCEYIVLKSSLATKPTVRTASRITLL